MGLMAPECDKQVGMLRHGAEATGSQGAAYEVHACVTQRVGT
jgi:hypothetical protein